MWLKRKSDLGMLPLVSGLLVTTRKDRHPFAQLAIKSFLEQNWPYKQVVVFNGTSVPFNCGRRVHEIQLRPMETHQMRNLILHNADGKFCALLFDDTWYEPDYLPTMMAGIGNEQLRTLRYKHAYSVSEKRTHMVDDDRIYCPVWRRLYPARFGATEADFAKQFYHIERINGPANLVVRITK